MCFVMQTQLPLLFFCPPEPHICHVTSGRKVMLTVSIVTKLSNCQKYDAVKEIWKPDDQLNFPFCHIHKLH